MFAHIHKFSTYLAVTTDFLKIFSRFFHGYYNVLLHKDNCHLSAFILPWCYYQYNTSPQGYIVSGEGKSQRFKRLLSPVLPTKLNTLMTLLWADNCTESFFNAANCLDIFGWLGFILNLTKFIFSKTLSHLLDLKSPIWQSAPMEKISRSHSEVSYSYQPHCHAFMLGSH